MSVTPEVASSSLVGPAKPFSSTTYIDQVILRPTAPKPGGRSEPADVFRILNVLERTGWKRDLPAMRVASGRGGSLPPSLPFAVEEGDSEALAFTTSHSLHIHSVQCSFNSTKILRPGWHLSVNNSGTT